MTKEFLSQDEVDALLKGVTGEADAPGPAEPAAGPRPYDLARPQRVVRGRLPALDLVNERFARLLRNGLFNLTRRTAEIAVNPVRTLKYGDFIRNLAVPTNLNIVQAKPLRGSALVVFDPTLVFLVVDSLFGGDGRFRTRIEGREFTPTEQRIIQLMLEMVFENLEASWRPVHPLKFEYVRAEMNAQFASIAGPDDVVVTTDFGVDFGSGVDGPIHVCMPYSMLEPVRDALVGGVVGEQRDVDKRWLRTLSRQVQQADVQVVANLCEIPVTLEQAMKLKVGDVIPANVTDTVVAEVGGVPVMECRYGRFNGQYALQVLRMIHAATEDSAAQPVSAGAGKS